MKIDTDNLYSTTINIRHPISGPVIKQVGFCLLEDRSAFRDYNERMLKILHQHDSVKVDSITYVRMCVSKDSELVDFITYTKGAPASPDETYFSEDHEDGIVSWTEADGLQFDDKVPE